MPFGSLWVPVVVSTAAVFLVSSFLHMVLKHHRADYRKLPDENAVGEVLRKHPASPGVYVIPYVMDPAAMKDPAVRKRYDDGPVGLITLLRNGPPALARNLAQWLALSFLISFTAAYVARHTLAPGADGMLVLRITGAVAFVGYGYGYIQDSIWKGIPWANSLRGIVDAVMYAAVTGVLFRLFWPGA
jgi:hypothetical protein